MTTNSEKMIFRPRPSIGWIWFALLGLLLSGVGIGLIVNSGFSGPFLITILITLAIGIVALVIAAFFPTMRYELDGSVLHVTYGPLLHYTIEACQIKSMRRRDLGFSLVSSFRVPGLALFNVPYPEMGTVKMCATAASNGILVIETDKAVYGLTPANEAEFVAELRKRMGR